MTTIETRSTTIANEVQRTVGPGRPIKWEAYAADVVEHYRATYPPALRTVSLSDAATASARMKADAQTIKRHLRVCGHEHGSTNCAADLEESLVAALPQPHRRELERALARRHGLLGVHMSTGNGSNIMCLERLAHEVGDVFREVAPALNADTATDEQVRLAEKELLDLEAVTRGMRETLQRRRAVKMPRDVWPEALHNVAPI